MAAFQQRKNGSWQARVRRHGVTKSAAFSTKSAAEAWARRVESEIERGLWHDTTEAERTTISELVSEYRRRLLPGLRGRGIASALNVLDEKLGKHTVARLTARHVASYRDERLRAVGAESVRKELGVLSKMLDTASKEWGITIPSNPVKNVSKPPPARARDRRLEGDEEARLLSALDQCRSVYMRPLAEFAIETAMRQGELLKLRWRDIDLKRRVAMLYCTKNGEDRAVPLTSRAAQILQGLPRNLHDERVFPVSQSLVVQAWGHAVKRAGIEDLHFHDLRHEALSRLAERGDLSVLELAAVSGHKTLQMLKRYTHLRAEDLARKLG
jgi:integrase